MARPGAHAPGSMAALAIQSSAGGATGEDWCGTVLDPSSASAYAPNPVGLGNAIFRRVRYRIPEGAT